MTKDPKIPENYQTVMSYLILKDAGKFIEFTENVFGATLLSKMMREEKIIMHAEISIKEITIMIADSTEAYSTQTTGLFVYVDNADIAYKLALTEGATIVTPISDQPYGRSGGVKTPAEIPGG